MFNTSDSFKSVIFDPKIRVFWGGPRGSLFSRFFLEFSLKFSKIQVSRFLLNAWSLWTRLCRCHMSHTWVLSSSVNDLRLRSLYPFTQCSRPMSCAFITFILRLWHEKQRPTRLLLIFRSLAQVTLMHASSALQLTLGHAQPGDVPLPTSSSWRGLPVVLDHIAFAFRSKSSKLAIPFPFRLLSHEKGSRRWDTSSQSVRTHS